MTRRGRLDMDKLCYWRIAKPRKYLERQEELAITDKKPHSVGRDVGDVNARSARATLIGSHLRAPARASERPRAAVGSARNSPRRRSLAQARFSPRPPRDERARAFSALLARRSRTEIRPPERSSGSPRHGTTNQMRRICTALPRAWPARRTSHTAFCPVNNAALQRSTGQKSGGRRSARRPLALGEGRAGRLRPPRTVRPPPCRRRRTWCRRRGGPRGASLR